MVGIIGAMQVEVEALKAMMQNVEIHKFGRLEFFKGILNGVDTVVAVAGVGKVNAAMCAQTMILKFSPKVVINIGVAGGVAKELKIGDIAIATTVVEHDMDTSPLGDEIGYISGLDVVMMPCAGWVVDSFEKAASQLDGIKIIKGVIASGDQFINSKEKKDWIADKFNAVAAEMEGASIGHVCYANSVDFCVIRAISDGAEDDSHLSFTEFVELAAKNSIKMILAFLNELKEAQAL